MFTVIGLKTSLRTSAYTKKSESRDTLQANMRRMKRIVTLSTCGYALLGNAGLVPINDVDELPGIFAELNLQLALFVDH